MNKGLALQVMVSCHPLAGRDLDWYHLGLVAWMIICCLHLHCDPKEIPMMRGQAVFSIEEATIPSYLIPPHFDERENVNKSMILNVIITGHGLNGRNRLSPCWKWSLESPPARIKMVTGHLALSQPSWKFLSCKFLVHFSRSWPCLDLRRPRFLSSITGLLPAVNTQITLMLKQLPLMIWESMSAHRWIQNMYIVSIWNSSHQPRAVHSGPTMRQLIPTTFAHLILWPTSPPLIPGALVSCTRVSRWLLTKLPVRCQIHD